MSKHNELHEAVLHLERMFPPIMHLFHQLAGQVSRLGEFSLAQYRVLMLVHHYGPMSIKTLTEHSQSAQSTASELVDRMVRQGLLRRAKNPLDLRVTLFELTTRSKKLIEQRKINMREVYSRLLSPLSLQQKNELLLAFETILKLTHEQPGAELPLRQAKS